MAQTSIQVLEDLEKTGSTKEKESILKRACSGSDRCNEVLRAIFVAAQDPYTTYYVNKFKLPEAAERTPGSVLIDDVVVFGFVKVILPTLADRSVTGNAARNAVTQAFSTMDKLQQKWCQRIVLKNLRCGVQETTTNKVWPGAIKKFTVQLAETLRSSFVKGTGIKILEHVSYPVRVEPKLDGLRCIAVKLNGIVTFYTRNGTIIDTLPSIKAALEDMCYDNVVLDGEMLADNNWNDSSSIMMSHKNKKDDSAMWYNVFDAMNVNDWIEQRNDEPYVHRCSRVAGVVASVPKGSHVKQVCGITVNDEQELLTFFQKCMDDGYEGIMLKDESAPYIFKRSDAIMKLKPIATWEGAVVGHYEGRRGTKNEGKFGGFEVVLPNGVVTRLGGGFKDEVKAEIQLNEPNSYIGRVVEIEGQPDPLTTDGLTKDGKIRFPVFLRFRDVSDVDPRVLDAFVGYAKQHP